MDEFAWTRTQAVLYNSICYAGLAVIAIISFVAVKFLTIWYVKKMYMYALSECLECFCKLCIHRLSERLVWMVAMFIIAFGFFTLIPMGNKYPSLMPEGGCSLPTF